MLAETYKENVTIEGIAQLVRARSSELEFSSSILVDSNVFFDFLPICIALA